MKKILTGLAALATLGGCPTQVLADNLNTMEQKFRETPQDQPILLPIDLTDSECGEDL